jgi:hypothetical protein
LVEPKADGDAVGAADCFAAGWNHPIWVRCKVCRRNDPRFVAGERWSVDDDRPSHEVL